jgi:microcystin-dependent protein
MRPAAHPRAPGPLLHPGFSAVPVGTVISYAGQLVLPGAAPDSGGPHALASVEAWGWMLCDGRALRCDQYQELYASLGGQYGSNGDDSFLIPDLRGYFVRGADPGATLDRDARTPLGNGSANDVGSRQDCALQDHVHLAAPNGMPVPQAGPPAPAAASPNGPTSSAAAPGNVHISAYETRPVNLALHYLIRFTNRMHHA